MSLSALAPEPDASRFRPWDATRIRHPPRLYLPHNADEVQALIVEAQQAEARLEIVGAGQVVPGTVDDVPDAGAWVVCLERMNRVLEVDRKNLRVRVQAGVRLHALAELLSRHGLSLPNLPEESERSLGGAVAAGAHGSGASFGILSTHVISLELAMADGRRRELTPDDRDTFAAARLSRGKLGVVTELTLEVVPAHRLEATRRTAPFEATLARLPELLADNAHLGLSWWPGTDELVVTRADRTSAPASRAGARRRWQGGAWWARDTARLLAWLGATFPERRARFNGALAWLARRREPVVGWSDELLAPRLLPPPVRPGAPRAVWHLPAARAAEALAAIRANHPVNGPEPVELRFLRADDILLSPAFGRDLCVVTLPGGRETTAEVALALEALEGAPAASERSFGGPGGARFRRVREALDPDGLFGGEPRGP